ncbi:DUF1413 domain-containing protein [Staphylococcus pasteuri]|uniref:DUF1413 domain-containing protein n=1 Tax=Staphylococcus pasteuri TaxID=45972 RepID=UPI000D3C427D|nr:DUF1413 domain-containing protein [Staphylococcus pasteuri]MEB7434858.1 single-stranded DNA-binding protein [Staphylococcus pasteuri]PTU84717.1 hypothetical protein BUZ62_10930 [Staphylococcus pasteuri]RFD68891.1 hypothetical protein A7974_04740 [Staphylococcus pasteuri]
MTFHDRILKLREQNNRTAFEFRFEELFSDEEWLEMSVAERKSSEKQFQHEVSKMSDVRMPFSSVDKAKNKLFNQVYAYNGIKKNFKQVEEKSNAR